MFEVLCEKEINNDDLILYCFVKRCSSDIYFRVFLKVLLLKIKESVKFLFEKEENFLLAVNKKGDIFFYFMVVDEKLIEILSYLFVNFVFVSEKLFKIKNN